MTRAIVGMVLVALLVTGCTAPDDSSSGSPRLGDAEGGGDPASSGEAIALSINDHWVQRAYYEATPEETLRTIEYVVAAKDLVRVGSEDVATYRIENKDGNRTIWIRTSDWAVVKTAVHGEETPVDPACVAYAWPASLGDSWGHSCRRLGTDVHGTAQDMVGQELHSRVVSEGRLSVTSGEFEVVELKTTVASGSSQHEIEEHFAAEACFPARTVIHGGDSPIIIDLIAYTCGGQ